MAQLQAVEDPRPNLQEQVNPTEGATSASLKIIMLALTALSQRTIIALSNLFALLAVASAFWVTMAINNPNPNQLVKIGMYDLFVLIMIFIVRRK